MLATTVFFFSFGLMTSYQCKTDIDCSLNGLCISHTCQCDKPWSGPQCGSLSFKAAPAAAASLYDFSKPENTWGGGIFSSDKKYVAYIPVYPEGKLVGDNILMLGVADEIQGPYNWTPLKDMCQNIRTYKGTYTNGTVVYTLWCKDEVRLSSSPTGPFRSIPVSTGGNPSPVLYNDTWYKVDQKTNHIFSTKLLDGNWTKFAEIDRDFENNHRILEDPFLWIDTRGNWHIVNHLYSQYEHDKCDQSLVSNHLFSPDGKKWQSLSNYQEPWSHSLSYANGSTIVYSTLERPFFIMNDAGQLLYLLLAGDQQIGAEGCENRTEHAHHGYTPCDNCKWNDHTLTLVAFLDV